MKKHSKTWTRRKDRPAARQGLRSQSTGASPTHVSPQNARRNYERYLALAHAQAAAGNLVGAENYYQHAEHYFRSMRSASGGGEVEVPTGETVKMIIERTLQFIANYFSIKPHLLKLLEDHANVLFCKVIRTMPRQCYLHVVPSKEPVSCLLPWKLVEPVAQQPRNQPFLGIGALSSASVSSLGAENVKPSYLPRTALLHFASSRPMIDQLLWDKRASEKNNTFNPASTSRTILPRKKML
jgi:Domain of unknown function (DUF4167)